MELNLLPVLYKRTALPTELRQLILRLCVIQRSCSLKVIGHRDYPIMPY